jgi:hypothetical protein
MRRAVWSMVVCALVLPGAGCLCFAVDVSRRSPTQDAGVVEHTDTAHAAPAADLDSRFAARCEAARQIADPIRRSHVFAKLAADAADAGQAEVVKQCVTAISDPLHRNQAAADCALRLTKAGQEPAALEMVHLVSDPIQRNEILAKVAMNEEGP